MTLTPIVEAHFPPEMRKVLEDETLRDQLRRPEEIAEVICFLASDAARDITGEIVAADSGFTASPYMITVQIADSRHKARNWLFDGFLSRNEGSGR